MKTRLLFMLTMLSCISAWGADYVFTVETIEGAVLKCKGDNNGNVTIVGLKSTPSEGTYGTKTVTIPYTIDKVYLDGGQSIAGHSYNVKSIANSAFKENNDIGTVVVPGSVETIGEYAFRSCLNLKSIQLANSITSIGANAFDGCKSLTSISLPSAMTKIEWGLFWGCTALESVTMPAGLTDIADYAFCDCNSLKRLIIPANVQSIGKNAVLLRCYSLIRIDVDGDNQFYDSRNDCCAIIETSTNKLLYGCKNTRIPDDVTEIAANAFYGCNTMTSVTIPSSVQVIGIDAFRECNNLASVTVEMDTPIYIGINTFSNRANATLYVPHGSKATYEAADLWNEFKEIVEMSAPSPVITFADTKVKELCVYCWDTNGDGELDEAEASAVSDIGIVFKGYEIMSFNELKFFTKLTTIDNCAFQNCSSLTNITLPNGLTSIGRSAFARCSSLQSVIIPDGVTSIGNEAFYECTVARITFGNSVASIGENAFYKCSMLSSLELPSCLKSIGLGAFSHCSGLNTVLLPDGLQSIGFGAFCFCSALKVVSIPASVTAIGDKAFDGCDILSSVKTNHQVPLAITQSTFSNRTNATLYVPHGCKPAYEEADYWKEFKEIIEMEEEKDTDISMLENAIYIEPMEGLAGMNVQLAVKMKNTMTPVGCSFRLTLPEGLRLLTNGNISYELGARAGKMSVTMKDWGDGSYDFSLMPSSTSATISGADGVIITFSLVLPDDIVADNYKLRLTNCKIHSKIDDVTQDTVLSDVVTTLTVLDYILGDVNGDGNITPSDAIMTLYHYFGVVQTGFNEKAADMNGDNSITPSDAIEMLYKYFGSSNAARAATGTLEPQ